MNRKMRSVLVLALAFVLLLTAACGAKAPAETAANTETTAAQETTQATTAAEKPDPFGKMAEVVEATTGFELPSDPKYPEGEDLQNNDVIKWIESNLNLKVKIDWTTSDQGYAFENKVNLLIASDDLPDYLNLNTEPYGMNILRKLVDNDMIEDMTKVFEDYASPTYKEFHSKANNVALNEVTYNGKLMAIPGIADTETAIPVVWVRTDWLEKLGLQGPKKVDDVIAIAKAFAEKDPGGNGKGLAMPFQQTMFRGDVGSMDFVFGAYNAFPGDWIKLADGSVGYGSVQPETKAALAKLADMYKNGVIDKEFALKPGDKCVEPIMANKVGIFSGAWWCTWWPLQDSIKNDNNAQWRAFFIAGDDGSANARSYPVVRNFVVVKKGYKHPEAIMKLANAQEEAGLKKYDWWNKLKFEPDSKYSATTGPLWPVKGGAKYLDEITRRYDAVMDVVNGKVKKEDADPETASIAQNILDEKANPHKDWGIWATATSWTHGVATFRDYAIQQKFPAYNGSTELMVKNKAVLEDLEKQTFLQIIMGKAPIEDFDKFVDQWKKLGGEEITKEINEIVKK